MKKEYLILAVVIAALSAYLFMHKQDRSNYTLPSIDEVATADVSLIKIEKGNDKINLTKKDEAWVLGDKGYPADTGAVSKMLDIIKDIKVTALVSENQDLHRYELDPENRIMVIAEGQSGVLRKFEVGKTAATYRHTFIRLSGDTNVYHAARSFRRDFDKSLDDLRDKSVLLFDKKDVKGMVLEKDGIKKELILTKLANSPSDSDSSAQEKSHQDTPDKPEQVSVPEKNQDTQAPETWKFKDGSAPDDDALERLLSMLSSLKCTKFADTDEKEAWADKEKICTIMLSGKKEMRLSVFSKDDKDNYPALSSENSYPFFLDTFQGENLASRVDTLLGIEKKEEKDDGVEKIHAGDMEEE